MYFHIQFAYLIIYLNVIIQGLYASLRINSGNVIKCNVNESMRITKYKSLFVLYNGFQ